MSFNMIHVTGDATFLPEDGRRKLLAHVCNTMNAWGAGFSGCISKRWKQPEQVFRLKSHLGENELGSIHDVRIDKRLAVVNMIAQAGLPNRFNPHPLNYVALERCLIRLAVLAVIHNADVHIPKIGCGLGGGEWSKVEWLIHDAFRGTDVWMYVYTLPGG